MKCEIGAPGQAERLDDWHEAPRRLVGAPLEAVLAHAPEYLHDPDTGRWWITSCGWPATPSSR
jgi:hypothetical protein